MDCPMDDLIETLQQGSEQYANVLANYCQLVLRPELTDSEAEQLASIYTAAEQEPLLNFFITELDAILGQRLGLLDNAQVELYCNQQAWLREHLEGVPYDKTYREAVQRLLQQHGFYEGPIDGVLGKRTQHAVKQFQESHRLCVDGVPGKKTFSALQTR
ncbi:peptidoglycan-binding domain-containing protein [Leptolyngbya sp. AN02str]|uniref:peptidoglycan-binding domain-containing protein n=1 Tax=Leptolyngbya sp. AN02str TaxID=3423363 RepID=UPI003D31116D